MAYNLDELVELFPVGNIGTGTLLKKLKHNIELLDTLNNRHLLKEEFIFIFGTYSEEEIKVLTKLYIASIIQNITELSGKLTLDLNECINTLRKLHDITGTKDNKNSSNVFDKRDNMEQINMEKN